MIWLFCVFTVQFAVTGYDGLAFVWLVSFIVRARSSTSSKKLNF